MNNKHIYLISGLGADERVFSRLEFPAGYETHFLPWIQPLTPTEPIEEYAARMARRILHPNPVLLGLSFGGMMSIEIARHIPVERVVLLSSVKQKQELPTLTDYAVRIPPGGKSDAHCETVITWRWNNREFKTRGLDSDQTVSAIKATQKMLNLI